MSYADRLQHWNRLYDQAPEDLRFHVVVWGVVAIGALNMLLTVSVGFPFGLLVILAIAALLTIRLPAALGWVKTSAGDGEGGTARLEIEGADGLYRLNRWYDRLSEVQQIGVLMAVLLGAGVINMLLTIFGGFPFGLLFLLALLALVAIRGPYKAGWLKPPAEGPMLAGNSGGAPLLHQESARPPAVEHQPAPEHAPEHTPERAPDPVRRD